MIKSQNVITLQMRRLPGTNLALIPSPHALGPYTCGYLISLKLDDLRRGSLDLNEMILK